MYHNFTNLADGNYSYTAYVQDLAGNVNSTENRLLTVDTVRPVVRLMSPANNNQTTNQNITLSCNITDNILISNLTVYLWNSTGTLLNMSTTSLSGVYNNASRNYTLPYGDVFKWNCFGSDNAGNAVWSSDGNYSLNYSSIPSAVTLVSPTNGNSTIHARMPTFTWTASSNVLWYEINVTSNNCLSFNSSSLTTNYTSISTLCLASDIGGGTYYNWTVRACNNAGCSAYAATYNFSIEPYVVITLVNNSINFTNMVLGQIQNTSSGTPAPFLVENDGNVAADLVNISGNQSLWVTPGAGLGTRYMQMAARVAKPNSFNTTTSQMTFVNVSMANQSIIKQLDYNDSKDTAYVDMLIEVPSSEPPGVKQASLIFYWTQSP